MKPGALFVGLIALLGTVASAGAQQPLGRLFFTPEQRSALDARRKARIPDKPAAAVAAESPTTRVDGHVVRSSGRSTIWVNGEPAPEGVEQEGLRVKAGRSDPGQVSVTVGDSARKFDLRVGEKLDRGSGEVRDVIGDGRIKVGR
jgi:hypothetical protein